MITDDLAALVTQAVFAARDAGEFALAEDTIAVKLETPANKQFGDYSSNIALTLKKATGINNSRDIADRILRHLPQGNTLIDRVEVAGPGFMNFYLKPTWLQDTLVQIEAQDRCYGTANTRAGDKILIEFVSANPTGPISVVNGRAAALGDVLGNLLASQGCTVSREFYINDALNSLQLEKFSETVAVRYLQEFGYPVHITPSYEGDKEILEPGTPFSTTLQSIVLEPGEYQQTKLQLGSITDYDLAVEAITQAVQTRFNLNDRQLDIVVFLVTHIKYLKATGYMLPLPNQDEPSKRFPPDGYRGEYVKDIAKQIVSEVGSQYIDVVDEIRRSFFRSATLKRMVDAQKAALEAFGLHFDTWFYESSLYESGAVDKTIAILTERGYTYRQDGALWLRSSALGDDKDRVLVRSNEKATYIAADAAYHDNKFSRGFNRLINIWGADHHGYVGRLKAGVAALGYPPENLEIVLTQMVSLVRDGEAVIGGKRQGNVIELKEDLIEDIGKDAARFYFLLNSYETPATVDVELAKRQDKENPVYYVQYAHARLCSILRKAEEQEITPIAAALADRSQLTHPSELDVLRKLADYPEEVRIATEKYAPHRLTHYAMDMAALLNVFYENCQVLPRADKPIEPEVSLARLALVNGSRIVLSNLLGLLGVTAPKEM